MGWKDSARDVDQDMVMRIDGAIEIILDKYRKGRWQYFLGFRMLVLPFGEEEMLAEVWAGM